MLLSINAALNYQLLYDVLYHEEILNGMAEDALVVTEIWPIEPRPTFRPFWLGKLYEFQLFRTNEKILHLLYREGIPLVLTLTKGGPPRS